MRIYTLFFSALLFFLFACGQNTAPLNNSTQNQTTIPVSQKVDAMAFKVCMDTLKDYQLVDVRTPEEYNSGHLSGALNNDVFDPEFTKRNESLDKNKAVLVYCKGGGRSADAAQQLVNAGFTRVIDMAGGIMAWQSNNLPLENEAAAVPDKFTESDFNAIIKVNTPVLVDFYAKWCIPCKKMEPVLEKLKTEFNGKVTVLRINVDEARELSKKQGVTALPVIKTFKNGKEITAAQGFQSEQQLRTYIAELLK